MTDPITTAARTAATALGTEDAPGLAAGVEAALRAPGPPGQHIDPVSFGILIVTIANVAWAIYADQRKRHPTLRPAAIARHGRAGLRWQGSSGQHDTDRITEIIQAARDLY